MPDQIGNILGGSLSSFGIGREAQAAFVCHQYNEFVRTHYKRKFELHAQAVIFRNNELVVHVTSSAWASELKLREQEIIRALAKKTSGPQISRVRYIVQRDLSHSQDS